jgi:tRNA1(Val) A37 N6-methylase TrmN6
MEDPPWLVLLEGRLGGRPGLRVEAPFVMRGEDGKPSARLRELYGEG